MASAYNDPVGGTPSDAGPQINTYHYIAKALKEAAKKEVFLKMADTITMPKNMGKTIKRYHEIPMLSDANINDQGIDAAGLSVSNEVTITIVDPNLANDGGEYITLYAVGNGADAAAALVAAKADAVDIFEALGVFNTDYATTKAALEALTPAWIITELGAVNGSGNLYGSSKDVGYISGKLPTIDEFGGFKNRVGFKRFEIEGTFQEYGMYYEYTQASLDFDTQPELLMHMHTKMIDGATQMQEAMLQIDLLNNCGVVRYGGEATSLATITGETGSVSLPSVEDTFTKLDIALTDNYSPKHVKMITGSRMQDTVTVRGGRPMYVGSEIVPMLRKLTDHWGNPGFVDVKHYAAGGTAMDMEIGAIGPFRIIEVPEMLHKAGVGDTVSNNAGYRETGGKYDAFPMLVVGDESFTTIGFKTGGKGRGAKLKTYHVVPGSQASLANDPYGKKGRFSLQFYYGFLVLRPERLAVVWTVAEV